MSKNTPNPGALKIRWWILVMCVCNKLCYNALCVSLQKGALVKVIGWLFTVIFLAIAVSFCLLNIQTVTLNYYVGQLSWPLSLCLVCAFVLGALLGLMLGFYKGFRKKRRGIRSS